MFYFEKLFYYLLFSDDLLNHSSEKYIVSATGKSAFGYKTDECFVEKHPS